MADYKLRVVDGPQLQRYRGLSMDPFRRAVAYYRLGEASGTVANDYAGGYNGAYTGTAGTTYTLGQSGLVRGDTAVLFNGGHVAATIPTLADEITFEAWIYPTSLVAGGIISLPQPSGQTARSLMMWRNSNGRLQGRTSDSGNSSEIISTVAIPDNEWTYVVFCRRYGGRMLYINGELDKEDSVDLWSTPGTALRIANSQSTATFIGKIDEAQIHQRVLTPKEIKDRFRQGPLLATGSSGAAELEHADIGNVTWVLNGSGSMEFGIPTSSAKGVWTELMKREVQVWRDDSLIWWGIPVQRRIFPHQTNISCLGLWEYFSYRHLHKSMTLEMDPQSIGWTLLNYAQTEWPGANLNIVSGPITPSGATVRRVYKGDEFKQISTLVHNLTDDVNGFDYEVEIFGDGRREWTPYYPNKGVVRNNEKIQWGRNIKEFEISEYSRDMANWITMIGEGEGPEKKWASFVDEAARDEFFLMQHTLTDSNVSNINTLMTKAQNQVAARKRPVQIPSVEVMNAPVPLIGVLKTGDQVSLEIDHGLAQVEGLHRITEMTLNTKTERMRLHFNKAQV